MFLLAGFLLLAPPVFFFGPLAGLLVLARPRTGREWLWLALAAGVTLAWLQPSADLTGQLVRGTAIFVTGSFVGLTLWRPSPSLSRALLATGLAAATLAGWLAYLDLGWGEIQRAVAHDLGGLHRALALRAAAAAGAADAPGDWLDQMAAWTRLVATMFPALLALAGVAGLRLAWMWQHRIAERPVGDPPTRFAALQFNDQLVWGWVVGLGLALFPLPAPWPLVGANLLLVWAVLYAARGLAVFAAGTGRVPVPLAAVLTLVAMVLLPFVMGGLTLLGLADTWLDFRRRLATPGTGGFDL